MLKIKSLKQGFYALNKKERTVFYISLIVVCISFISIISKLNERFLVAIPQDGGNIVEGIIGTPTLVNPVLAVTDADKDLVALVYSGLLRKAPNGDFIPDLAESYTVSPDGTIYTFTLKDNITFHSGKNITASDVVFTINQIKDPLVKSPKSVQWQGVTVEEKDPKTVVFTLKQPYISFLDNLTTGIISMDMWKNIAPNEFSLSKLNLKGVGSGPYMIDSIDYTNEGIPTAYHLVRFKKFVLGTPHIKKITIQSFSNEKDLIQNLKNGDIDQAGGISASYAQTINPKKFSITGTTLPRSFGIFFNQGQNKVLGDKVIRQAINTGLDRKEVIDQVLKGYGASINNPITKKMDDVSVADSQKNAIDLLEKNGWKSGIDGIREKGTVSTITTGKGKNKKTVQVSKGPKSRLSFTLTTGDAPELSQTAEIIKKQMLALGIDVNIKIYETGTLNQIIRSRNYEALLFGQVMNHESDIFAFWHSSQKNDPGLNIALYSNKSADIILEQIQKSLSLEERKKKYNDLSAIFTNDIPAVFIYSPEYIYATSNDLDLEESLNITLPSDRFSSVYLWYTEKDMVWKIFTK